MKLSALFTALALALGATAAFAVPITKTTAIFPVGPNATIDIGNSFAVKAPATSDAFTFTLIKSAVLNGSLSSTASTLGQLDYDFKSVVLDGPGASDITYSLLGSDKFEFVELDDAVLLPGAYTLRILGKTDGKNGGSWSGNLNLVAAVPEPETDALLLGGLGALAFVSKRRRAAT